MYSKRAKQKIGKSNTCSTTTAGIANMNSTTALTCTTGGCLLFRGHVLYWDFGQFVQEIALIAKNTVAEWADASAAGNDKAPSEIYA